MGTVYFPLKSNFLSFFLQKVPVPTVILKILSLDLHIASKVVKHCAVCIAPGSCPRAQRCQSCLSILSLYWKRRSGDMDMFSSHRRPCKNAYQLWERCRVEVTCRLEMTLLRAIIYLKTCNGTRDQ